MLVGCMYVGLLTVQRVIIFGSDTDNPYSEICDTSDFLLHVFYNDRSLFWRTEMEYISAVNSRKGGTKCMSIRVFAYLHNVISRTVWITYLFSVYFEMVNPYVQ